MRSSAVFLLLAGVAVGACGDFVESTDSMHLATIDNGGGVVAFQGLEIQLPAGATSDAITFHVTREPIAGALADVYRVEPVARRFATMVSVSITTDGVPLPPPGELFIADFQHHPAQPLAGQHMDAHSVSGTTTATGLFGLLRCPNGTCPH